MRFPCVEPVLWKWRHCPGTGVGPSFCSQNGGHLEWDPRYNQNHNVLIRIIAILRQSMFRALHGLIPTSGRQNGRFSFYSSGLPRVARLAQIGHEGRMIVHSGTRRFENASGPNSSMTL